MVLAHLILQRCFLAVLLLPPVASFVSKASSEPLRTNAVVLDIDRIILGLRERSDAFNRLESWEVRYTHERPRGDAPRPVGPDFPVYEIVNARAKSMRLLVKKDVTNKREEHVVFRDGVSVEQIFETKGRTITPGPHLDLLQFSFYTNSLFIDIYEHEKLKSRTLIKDSGGDNFSGLNPFLLPRDIEKDRSAYRVHPSLEDVRGFACHVVEKEGKDIIYVDANNDFVVRKRILYYPAGDLRSVIENLDFERVPCGLLLPRRQTALVYEPAKDRGKQGLLRYTEVNTLLSFRHNALSPDYFTPPSLESGVVDDQVLGRTYKVFPRQVNPLEAALVEILKNEKVEPTPEPPSVRHIFSSIPAVSLKRVVQFCILLNVGILVSQLVRLWRTTRRQ